MIKRFVAISILAFSVTPACGAPAPKSKPVHSQEGAPFRVTADGKFEFDSRWLDGSGSHTLHEMRLEHVPAPTAPAVMNPSVNPGK